MSIPFTQFLRPDGRRRHIEIDMPESVELKAKNLTDRGARFEIEELTTGEVYMECLARDGELLANQLCPNGPPVVQAVIDLIDSALGMHKRKDAHMEIFVMIISFGAAVGIGVLSKADPSYIAIVGWLFGFVGGGITGMIVSDRNKRPR